MSVVDWERHVRRQLVDHGLPQVQCELRYASWASLGAAIEQCGQAASDWKIYADDVVEQLRLNVLMGYDGAPAVDGLEGGLTMKNAVELFHRMLEAGRQLYLALHGQKRYADLMLGPYWPNHRVLRDGLVEAPAAGGDAFATTVLLSLYRKPAWQKGENVFVSIDLSGADGPGLVVGVGLLVQETNPSPVNRWAWADDADGDLGDEHLDGADKAVFPYSAEYDPGAKWIFDARPWLERQGDADIAWVLDRLAAGVAVWDARLEQANAEGVDRGGVTPAD